MLDPEVLKEIAERFKLDPAVRPSEKLVRALAELSRIDVLAVRSMFGSASRDDANAPKAPPVLEILDDTSFKRNIDIYGKIVEQIGKEDSIIHDRVTWGMQINGALFTLFAAIVLFVVNQIKISNEHGIARVIMVVVTTIMLGAISSCGIWSCLQSIRGVQNARRQLYYITYIYRRNPQWRRQIEEQMNLPIPFGTRKNFPFESGQFRISPRTAPLSLFHRFGLSAVEFVFAGIDRIFYHHEDYFVEQSDTPEQRRYPLSKAYLDMNESLQEVDRWWADNFFRALILLWLVFLVAVFLILVFGGIRP